MTEKLRVSLKLARIEALLKRAEKIRRKTFKADEVCDPALAIDRRVNFSGNLSYEYIVRDDLKSGFVKVLAYVDIRDKIKLYIDRVVFDAASYWHPRAREVLAHEIGHIVVHATPARRKKVVQLHRGVPEDDALFKSTRTQEEEADIFMIGYLVPYSAVSEKSTVERIMLDYRVTAFTAEAIIYYSRWISLKGMRDGNVK